MLMKKFYTFAMVMAMLGSASAAIAQEQVKLLSFTFPQEAAGKFYKFGISATDGQQVVVDWGDGKLTAPVKVVNYDDDWAYTEISGKIAGDAVTIYGTNAATINNIDFSWNKDFGEECKITSVNLSGLSGVKAIDFSTNNLTSLNVIDCKALTTIDAGNNALSSLEFPYDSGITTLRVQNTDGSGKNGTNHLSTLDFSKLPKLKTLNINYNSAEGETMKLDFSSNPDLTTIDAMECGITELNISKNNKLTTLRVNNNELTELDASNMNPSKNAIVFAIGNKLTSVKPAPKMTTLNVSNNNFSFATLPAVADVPAKNYIYNPQKAMEVTPDGLVVDLSSQAEIAGTATVYAWKANGEALESGFTADKGVFTFDAPVEKAVCSMTNAMFPKLTLETVALDIKGSSAVSGIESENAPAEYFNLQGIRVENPENGIFIRRQGGKTVKVIIK